MNKGTALVGFFMSFMVGMGLMWTINRDKTGDLKAEPGLVAEGVDQSAAAVPVSAKDPFWGNPNAPVTIVEISDFECPFCSRVEPTMEQIKTTYGPDKVRIVWKNNPLPFHAKARPAHEAAVIVHQLGGNDAFWKFHKLAFANQRELTAENLEKWAVASGVDGAKFKADMAAKKGAAKVDEDLATGRKIGANGTPNFRINGVEVSGAQPFEAFKKVIDEQLAEAAKLKVKPSEVYVTLTNKNAKAAPAGQDDAPQKPAEAPKPPPDDTTIWAVPVLKEDPVLGPADAPVTIVIFSDFQCPFCKRVEDTMKKVRETYGNDVRIVWKDNTLPFHPRAKPAAALARMAYDTKGDKGFWDAHEALFESQPKLEDADLEGIAKKLGIDWARTKAAIDSGKYDKLFGASMDLAADFGAQGTPHFFVNGYRVKGAQPFEKFKEVIDAQLAKAKGLIAAGTPKAKVYEAVMREGKAPPPPEKKEVAAPTKANPFRGGATAKVTIQVFSDFQCPFCKRVEPTMDEIEKAYGSKVKIVWRNMPLSFHEDAPLAAEAAMEAFEQKGNAGFWAYHKALFEAQGTPDGIKRPGLEKIAQEQGLDMAKFKAALDSHKHKAQVDADNEIGQKAGISGTPAAVINGYFVSGAQPFPAFKKLIDRALKEAGG